MGSISTSRSGRLAATIAIVGALLLPVVRDRDSFPLSTYPMYARARSDTSTIVTAYGLDAADSVVELTPTLIGNSDDPLVVVGELRADLAADRGDRRCRDIATRVGDRAEFADVVRVEIVWERHDTVTRTLGDDSLIDRDVAAVCEVER